MNSNRDGFVRVSSKTARDLERGSRLENVKTPVFSKGDSLVIGEAEFEVVAVHLIPARLVLKPIGHSR